MRTDRTNVALARTLSLERLSKCLAVAGNDLDSALKLYERNLRLSEAFHTPLHCFEITLRNVLNEQMSARYGMHWLRTDGTAPLEDGSKTAITKALEALAVSDPPDGAIIAELNLGFWVGLIGPRYDASLWRAALHHAFRASGRGLRRSDVHSRINALRRFRNRVAHHEPIFDRDLDRVHREIIETISWMCPETAAWAIHNSRFDPVFNADRP